MSLPDIADFARNFAVMVRIQGPDPKGLKMRKHAFHLYNSGTTTLSASGMLFPGFSDSSSKDNQTNTDVNVPHQHNSVLVLTVSSIIEPFLSPQHKENIPKGKPVLVNGVEINVMVESKMETNLGGSTRWLPVELLKMVDISASSDAIQSLVEDSSSSPEHGWEVGWSLTSDATGNPSNSDGLRLQVEKSSIPSLLSKSTTSVAILRVSSLFMDLPKFSALPQGRKGSLLLAIGSPFGILSPMHFLNSISVGSIANSYPPYASDISLLTADIRCLPGMEGSPVFGEHGQLIGMLTRPLRQRLSDAEIQLVIPWEAIESSCSHLVQEEHHLSLKNNFINNGNNNAARKKLTDSLLADISSNNIHESIHSPSLIEEAITSICLININGGAWASGIFLNKQGLILTNAHLLEPWRFGKATSSSSSDHRNVQHSEHTDSNFNFIRNLSLKSIRVRLDSVEPWIWTDARVVYVSKGPLDVALLQIEFVPDQLVPINVELACPSPGSKVYVIGHGLFGPRSNFLPSACLGVVSKIVYMMSNIHEKSDLDSNKQGPPPAMLETTASVHAGGSGGAIVDLNGNMVALVTSNARHGGETVIPHLNFSIPCAALEPIFKFSKDMKSLSILEELDKPNEHVAATWALMSSLTPKPHPSLPRIPRVQPGDNGKDDAKGSRFAKFMAERHDLFKNASLPGTSKL